MCKQQQRQQQISFTPIINGLLICSVLFLHCFSHQLGVLSSSEMDSQHSGSSESEEDFGLKKQWFLVWSDEFNGPEGTPPNQSNWVYNIGDIGNGWGNWELEYYTNSTKNVRLDGRGNLVIEARNDPHNLSCYYGPCNYTSGRITTGGKFSHKYGRVEARIKIPRGQGMWPAFWMLGNSFLTEANWPDCGEIDIMENVGNLPQSAYGSLHGPNGYNEESIFNVSYGSLADEFHCYGIVWTSEQVVWYVDNVEYGRKLAADASTNSTQWVFNDQEFYILLNVAVGGTWPHSPNASTVFPQQMLVDYVRVYQQ